MKTHCDCCGAVIRRGALDCEYCGVMLVEYPTHLESLDMNPQGIEFKNCEYKPYFHGIEIARVQDNWIEVELSKNEAIVICRHYGGDDIIANLLDYFIDFYSDLLNVRTRHFVVEIDYSAKYMIYRIRCRLNDKSESAYKLLRQSEGVIIR